MMSFGDCLAYATAAVAGDTLLLVGNEFRKTDMLGGLTRAAGYWPLTSASDIVA